MRNIAPAEEATKLSKQMAKELYSLDGIVQFVDDAIFAAAQRGLYQIRVELYQFNSDLRTAVLQKLRDQKYFCTLDGVLLDIGWDV